MSIYPKTIGAKLLGAFLLMSTIIASQGIFGYGVLSKAGAIVGHTFDRSLMAINYSRAANLDFVRIEQKQQQWSQASKIDRATIDSDINDLASAFTADLSVAEERSSETEELLEIGKIKSLMTRWTEARKSHDTAKISALAPKIDAAFDLLIEFNTGNSFVDRRKSVDAISWFGYVLIGGLAASLLAAFAITIVLSRRIARPLSHAASVADRIADGEFDTTLPVGGEDETGILLRSMTVMQRNIRMMMERETARAASAEGRLTDALETSSEGVMLVNSDGLVTVLNKRLRSFFPDVAIHLVPGTNYELFKKLSWAQFASHRDGELPDDHVSANDEYRLPDGRWIRISASPTRDNGNIIFISDFTEIKNREEKYRQAKQEAEAANAAKSRFLANMSHELRTPLNAIIGFSDILERQMFGALGNERYVEYSADILRSGRHLLEVINGLLELSKSESGKLELRPQHVDLRYILEDCAKMVRLQCAEAKLAFHLSGLDHPLPVFGDETKLRQIFLNLLSNAIKFTESGGTVSLIALEDDKTIVISVRDSGIGMSSKDVQVALTPFGQVDNRLERKYEGTGLGLPLAKCFVELHDASLQIESERNRGTVVTVRFPRDFEAVEISPHLRAVGDQGVS